MEAMYHKLYSKRSGNWRAEPVKVKKDYSHLQILMADVLRRREEDVQPILRRIEISPSNPKNIAPTIALKESPATSDLVQARISRLKNIDTESK